MGWPLQDADGAAAGRIGLERRSHRRIDVDARIEIESTDGARRARVLNLSMGGLAASTDLLADDVVVLRVDLGDGARFETRGELVWSRDGVTGFRFISLGQSALLALLRVVGRA